MNKTQTDIPWVGAPVISPSPEPPEATCSVRLSERDAADVEAVAEKPPAPNEAALRAAQRFLQTHG